VKIISKPHIYASLFLLLISVAGASHAQIPQPERDALIALYNSTGGAEWSNSTGWLGAAGTECDWYGITCLNGSVTELRLGGNSLSGSIPSELVNLTNLRDLYLHDNSLSGNIPAELGNLTNLTSLALHSNSLSGSIPSELGNLTNLTNLYLDDNRLSGNIPAELGNLTNLSDLFLYSNSLSGSIPAELGNLTNLTVLDLKLNSLSDSIPAELGNLTNLTYLSLWANVLSGSIPSELGNLTNLTTLLLFSNSLSGSIPSELGSLINLTGLYLNNNSLSGSIPSEIGNLTNLTNLNLDNNSLSGSIPTSLNSFSIGDSAFNVAPAVIIPDGNRTIDDTDGAAGETVSFTATATDSDGSVASSSWLINGAEVASGTSANLTLGDGSTTVTFRATDDDGDSTSKSVTITVVAPLIPNLAPVVAIIGGNRSIVDTDGLTGETVSLSATATDADGELASTSWLVGDAEVASGTSAYLTLGDGSTTVTFRATDDDGESTSKSVTITVSAPVVANVVPVVSISGGDRTVSDSDASAGETVSLSASATDSDGSVSSTEWLVGGSVVATGTSADLSLPDGATEVTFRATDSDGDSSSTSVTITVSAPVVANVAPEVSINLAQAQITDTDGVAGEVVSVTAAATDSDGELASTSWLIGDEVVASGTSARLPLSDGSTTVTFRATDDDGDSTSTSVTITVEAPVETEEEFVTEYNGIAAPSFLSEEINTVSVFDINKLKLRSCIRLTLEGEPYSLNGYEQYDMNFNLLSLVDLTFKLVDFRPFNLNGSSNQFGETPDCSGQFELSSNVYKDIIAVPGTTEAGNLKYDYYDLVIDLIDVDSLLFRLRDISIITGPSSVR